MAQLQRVRLVLWYRDSAYSLNDEGNHLAEPPSIGAKGTVLVVDAHPDPEHYTGAAAQANPNLLDALPAHQQAMDAAFGPLGRYPFQACVGTDPERYYKVACNRFGFEWGRMSFTDAIGWYPGFEYRPDLDHRAAAGTSPAPATRPTACRRATTGRRPTTRTSLGVGLTVQRATPKAGRVLVRPGHRAR